MTNSRRAGRLTAVISTARGVGVRARWVMRAEANPSDGAGRVIGIADCRDRPDLGHRVVCTVPGPDRTCGYETQDLRCIGQGRLWTPVTHEMDSRPAREPGLPWPVFTGHRNPSHICEE